MPPGWPASIRTDGRLQSDQVADFDQNTRPTSPEYANHASDSCVCDHHRTPPASIRPLGTSPRICFQTLRRMQMVGRSRLAGRLARRSGASHRARPAIQYPHGWSGACPWSGQSSPVAMTGNRCGDAGARSGARRTYRAAMLSTNSIASRAMVPYAYRARYFSICSSPHVRCPLDLVGRVVFMPMVESVLHSPSAMANAIRCRITFNAFFLAFGVLPSSQATTFR